MDVHEGKVWGSFIYTVRISVPKWMAPYLVADHYAHQGGTYVVFRWKARAKADGMQMKIQNRHSIFYISEKIDKFKRENRTWVNTSFLSD